MLCSVRVRHPPQPPKKILRGVYILSKVDRKQIGRIGLSMAINYFTHQGYTVSIPMNDTQWYDLVIEKDGNFKTVQCKATQTKNNAINLKNSGGTRGVVYDNIINHPELDFLFCVNKKLDMRCIPIAEILKSGNRNSITLQEDFTNNGLGFQTCKYQVRLS